MASEKVPFHLLKFTPAEDGEQLGMTIEVQPEFESWFMKAHNLSEWDEDKFKKWFKTFLTDAAKDRLQGRSVSQSRMSEQQRVDVYSREGLQDDGD